LNRRWMISIFVLSVLFVGLSLIVHYRLAASFDLVTLAGIQRFMPRDVDVPFSLLTWVGAAEVTGLVVLVILIFIRPLQRVLLILSFGLTTLVEIIGKTIINQPTTPDELRRYVPLFFQIPSSAVNPGYSYPSGHALRTMLIVILLAALLAASRAKRPLKIILAALLVSLEIVMLVSRVYLAEHWTTDVIGGALLGVIAAMVLLSQGSLTIDDRRGT
jgi:membrane-associated phospholipid phosphatase